MEKPRMPISTMVAKRLKSVNSVKEYSSFPSKHKDNEASIDHLRCGTMKPPNKYMASKTREPTVDAVTRVGKAEAKNRHSDVDP